MDTNIKNFIKFTKVELTATIILKNIFLFSIWILMGGILSFHLGEFLIAGFLYMGIVVLLGVYFMQTECAWGMSMYSGLYGVGSAAFLFAISYVSLAILSGVNGWIIFMYILIYIFCCACFILNTWDRIKKDAYGKNADKTNPVFAYLGSGAALLLAPIIFSNFNRNQIFTYISFAFLFLGVVYTMSSGCFLTAFMQKRYS